MKRIGAFLTGAALCGAVLFGYDRLTTPSDYDVLQAALFGNCLPYVVENKPAFTQFGNDIDADQLIVMSPENAARFQHYAEFADQRFEAVWGRSQTNETTLRVCQITTRYLQGQPGGFDVPSDIWLPQTIEQLADYGLVPEETVLTDGRRTLAFTKSGVADLAGLRMVFVAQPDLITNVVVAQGVD
ncbi:hypothetical protein [Aestuariibius sp. HNIBRBA575]|uniref:hypothetical protein n=1 Tax=Aestuariibius sp. HNIBRBA575 TaxID=3233343 RepID=UPI0034A3CB3B